jgi:hypothetical protein
MNRFHYFVTDLSPNGTRDLIIYDTKRGTETIIEEAVFGGQFKPQRNCYGEYLSHDGFGISYAPLNADTQLVFEVRLKDVLRRIAVSPVNDGRTTVDRIMRARRA